MAASSKQLQILIVLLLTAFIQDKIAKDPTTHGSMFISIILGSDKTTVLVGTSDNEYYPLYASMGNVHNNVCHTHRNSLTLISFLVIPKSEPNPFFSHAS